jgi:hypothetical protein
VLGCGPGLIVCTFVHVALDFGQLVDGSSPTSQPPPGAVVLVLLVWGARRQAMCFEDEPASRQITLKPVT